MKKDSEMLGQKVFTGLIVLISCAVAIYYLGFFIYEGFFDSCDNCGFVHPILYFMIGLMAIFVIGMVGYISYFIGDFLIGD